MHLINHNLNRNVLPIGGGVLVSDPIDAPNTNSIASCVSYFPGNPKRVLTYGLVIGSALTPTIVRLFPSVVLQTSLSQII
jgi:hypothetical protein